jgi:hypothetical protein
MKFTIVILSDWQVTLLLTPGHVRAIVKKVEDDHIVCREQLQRLLHLGGHLFHGCLIQMPSLNCSDNNLEASVQEVVPLIDGVTATDAPKATRHIFINKKVYHGLYHCPSPDCINY